MRSSRAALAIIAIGSTAALPAAGIPSNLPGTPVQKPTITAADYGRWERLGFDTALSPDGRWLAAPISRVDGTSELRLHAIAGGDPIVVAEGAGPRFSDDSAWLAFRIGYAESERERMQERREPIRSKLGLIRLTTAGGDTEPEIIEAVAGFGFGGGGRWLAMHKYAPQGAEHRGADVVVRDLEAGTDLLFGNVAEFAWQEDGALLAMTIDAADRAGNGVQLWNGETGILRVLDSGDAVFRGLAWRDDGDDLAVLRSVDDEAFEEPTHRLLAWRGLARQGPGDTPSATVFDPAEAEGFPADFRVVEHRSPQWSDDGGSLFFGIKEWERKPEEELESGGGQEAAGEVEGAGSGGVDEGGERPREERQETPAQDEESDTLEPANVEVWHSFDERIIPMQKVQKERDRRRNYLAVWHVDEDRFVRLGTDLMETVSVLEGQRHAVETDRTPYGFDNMFDRSRIDVWLLDTRTGERDKVIDGTWYFRGGSATGRYLLWFADDRYWTHDIETGRTASITDDLPATFVDEDYDTPVRQQRPPWGHAGWSETDDAVLLYDRYDVWSVRPDGSAGRRLTAGAEEEVRHRVVRLDREAEGIDLGEPVYLSLYGEWTKRFGFARTRPAELTQEGERANDGGSDGANDGRDEGPTGGSDGGRNGGRNRADNGGASRTDSGASVAADPVERLVFEEANLGRLTKAEDAEVYAYVAQDFHDSPDVFAAGPELADARQVTRTNPFQDDFAWGRSELVDYESATGRRLQGALYRPANYEPGRRYPMIVYVYETLSQSVHSYEVPSERDPYNPAVWTSQGYFVLTPDIVFRDRDPGVSAVECVVPAVEKVLESGRVDPQRVGLVGHSWGGYEASFIPTQTDVFAAAVAGAPLTNFFSMFGTIHWNQGMPESSHFETGQARMDVPYWEDMEAYVRNSPVMFVHQLETPMLVFFGDEDGTVDWHQGVELYNYARRAGKHLVMLVYPGENHSARRKENQIDYHRRVLQWFDHFLKGAEAPGWITEGVTVLERERQLEPHR